VRNASIIIQNQFEEFFSENDIPCALPPFTSSSDYQWFLYFGIPAGGLATGAGGIKTYAEKDIFGGVALAPYDLCYHKSCDTVNNIDGYALRTNLHAAASVVEKFAMELPRGLKAKSSHRSHPISTKINKLIEA